MKCGNCKRAHDEVVCPHCGCHRPTDATRKVMRANKSKNTGPERVLARELRKLGLRPKRHDSLRPGCPDFSFPSARVAVFVDGEFWHGKGPAPKTNAAWWAAKFARTIERDRRNEAALLEMGWLSIRLSDREVARCPEECAIAAALALDVVRAGVE